MAGPRMGLCLEPRTVLPGELLRVLSWHLPLTQCKITDTLPIYDVSDRQRCVFSAAILYSFVNGVQYLTGVSCRERSVVQRHLPLLRLRTIQNLQPRPVAPTPHSQPTHTPPNPHQLCSKFKSVCKTPVGEGKRLLQQAVYCPMVAPGRSLVAAGLIPRVPE